MSLAVLVPVDQGERYAARILDAIATQSLCPDEVWIAETDPTEATRRLVEERGARHVPEARREYDHGGTRTTLVRATNCEHVILLSQDAIPVGRDAFRHLVAPLEDARVAATFGRQLAPPGCHPFTALKREFLYPELAGEAARGGKALHRPFLSNAFAAYRRSALASIGWFGEHRLMCEDVVAAARLVREGLGVVYVPDATAEHGNELGLVGELRRYFDIGASHAAEAWIDEAHGTPASDGVRFVAFGVRWLAVHRSAHLVPLFGAFSLLKRVAYTAGRRHHLLPGALVCRLSGLPDWWRRGGS